MRAASLICLLVASALAATGCRAIEDDPVTETPAIAGPEVEETIMAADADEPDAEPTPAVDRGPVHTPADGLVRPGGPVNQPVPGLAVSEAWPDLQAQDVAGEWQMELTGGFAACTIMLGPVNPAGSGALSSQGACPFGPRKPVRWRYDAGLGQLALLDEAGSAVMTAHRRGPYQFDTYSPGVGLIKLTPKN